VLPTLSLGAILTKFKDIEREAATASNVDEVLAIVVRRVKDSLPIDAFAVYLTGTEAGQYVLKASDRALHEPTDRVRSGAQAGLMGLVGERGELIILNNAPAHPRYAPAAETGERPLGTFAGSFRPCED
jgi:phosphotransferase system enzyme I (PtsP)